MVLVDEYEEHTGDKEHKDDDDNEPNLYGWRGLQTFLDLLPDEDIYDSDGDILDSFTHKEVATDDIAERLLL